MSEVKTFFIPTVAKPIVKTKSVQVPTGQKERGFFGGEKNIMRTEQRQEIVGYSNSAIDGFALTQDMHKTIDSWLAQDYELFSITPITSGARKYHTEYHRSYGYGYSYTEGIMVVLKKA